jgi:phosphoserine phosphatase
MRSANRSKQMPTFQILYLRESILDHSEEVDLRDLLDAIDRAMVKAPGLTAEIRCDGARVGLVGASLSEVPRPAEQPTAAPEQESEIAEEMKMRLRLVR